MRDFKLCVIGICLLVSFIPWGRSSTHFVNPANSTPISPYTDWTTAATNIQDAINVASSGETVLATNGMYNIGSTVANDGTPTRLVVTNSIFVTSVNGSTNTIIDGGSAVRCVYLMNGAHFDGFTLAHGKAGTGGGAYCASTNELISNCQLLNNSANNGAGGGAYQGTLTNCLMSGNSVTGPFTVDIGGGAANQSFLINCTLVNNKSASGVPGFGGGARYSTLVNCIINNNSVDFIYGEGGALANSTAYYCTLSGNNGGDSGAAAVNTTLYNCTISGNSAPGTYRCTLYNCWSSGNVGGGSQHDTLYNCILTGNNSGGHGGGAWNSTLYNCTVTGNSAQYGGGVEGCAVVNSIVYNNTAALGGQNYFYTNGDTIAMTLNYCCTAPLPGSGLGNISVDPLFTNAAANDFHLQSSSPCINSGNNIYVSTNVDFDNNARIAGQTVDMGAYEFQTPSSILSYAWAQQYGLPTDGSADFADPDDDGMNNWQEWIAGTDPLDATSVLRMSAISNNASGLQVAWQSVSGKTYYLQRATNLYIQPAFSSIRSNIAGQVTNTSVNDSTATDPGPYFYRVGVQH